MLPKLYLHHFWKTVYTMPSLISEVLSAEYAGKAEGFNINVGLKSDYRRSLVNDVVLKTRVVVSRFVLTLNVRACLWTWSY